MRPMVSSHISPPVWMHTRVQAGGPCKLRMCVLAAFHLTIAEPFS